MGEKPVGAWPRTRQRAQVDGSLERFQSVLQSDLFAADPTRAEIELAPLAEARRSRMIELMRSNPRKALDIARETVASLESVGLASSPALADQVEMAFHGTGGVHEICCIPDYKTTNPNGPCDTCSRVLHLTGPKPAGARNYYELSLPPKHPLAKHDWADIPVHAFLLGGVAVVVDSPYYSVDPSEMGTMETTDSVSEGNGLFGVHTGERLHRFDTREARDAHLDHLKATSVDHPWPSQGKPRLQTGCDSVSDYIRTNPIDGAATFALLRVNFTDRSAAPTDGSATITLSSAQASVDAMRAFYNYSSVSRFIPSVGTTLGWNTNVFRTTVTTFANLPNIPDIMDLLTDARERAYTNVGLDFCNYDYEFVLFDYHSGIGWAGLANVGFRGGWLNGNIDPAVWAHEAGHNLGQNHARSWQAASDVDFPNGDLVEYGDLYDIMGDGGIDTGYFSNYYKSFIGWADTCQIATFNRFSLDQTIELYPSDSYTSTLQTTEIRFTRSSAVSVELLNVGSIYEDEPIDVVYRAYTIEYRRKFGDANTLNGLFVKYLEDDEDAPESGAHTILRDSEMSTATLSDAMLALGRTFSVCDMGFHVTPLKTQPCVHTADTCMLVSVVTDYVNAAITITFVQSSPVVITAGGSFQLNATTSGGGGRTVYLWWDMGDGTTYSMTNGIQHSFSSIGIYPVKVIASNLAGSSIVRLFFVSVKQAGYSPTQYAYPCSVGSPLVISAYGTPGRTKLTIAHASLPLHTPGSAGAGTTDGYTICAKMKVDTIDDEAYRIVFAKSGSGSDTIGLQWFYDSAGWSYFFPMWDWAGGTGSTGPVNGFGPFDAENNYIHVCVRVKKAAVDVFVQGTLYSSYDEGMNVLTNTNPLTVGEFSSTFQETLMGRFSALRFYNFPLTDLQVTMDLDEVNVTATAITTSSNVAGCTGTSCANGIQDGSETSIDCGGTTCGSCSAPVSCAALPCEVGHNQITAGTCTTPLASGTSCMLGCGLGYSPTVPLNITCYSGNFSPIPGVCILTGSTDCIALPTQVGSNGYLAGTCTTNSETGTTCNLACNTGASYTASGTLAITCTNGAWGTLSGSCLAPCTSLPASVGSNQVTAGTCSVPTTSGATPCQLACNGGYTTSGSMSQTCTNGAWSTFSGSCTPSPCASLPSQVGSNGVTAGNCQAGAQSGSSCTLGCDTNYVPSGGLSVTCTTGSWTSPSGSCSVAQCSTLPGAVSTPSAHITAGNCSAPTASGGHCVLACANGYTLSSGSLSTTCSSTSWTSFSGVCTGLPCDALTEAPQNGALGSCSSSIDDGATCSITCNNGFTVAGDPRLCSAGTLQGSAQSCEEAEGDFCQDCTLTAPPNGDLGTCASDVSEGSSCSFTCDPGYTLSGAARVCEAGAFTGSPQNCTANACSSLPAQVGNGNIVAGGCTGTEASGASCVLGCDIGFVPSTSGSLSVTCTAGSYSTPTGSCVTADPCSTQPDDVGVTPHVTIGDCELPLMSGLDCLLSCESPYTPDGDFEVVCTDGEWSAITGICRGPDCLGLGAYPTTKAGTTALVACNDDGEIGSIARPCSIDGVWGVEVDQCSAAGGDVTVHTYQITLVFNAELTEADAATLLAEMAEAFDIPTWRLVLIATSTSSGSTTVTIGITNNYLNDASSTESSEELAQIVLDAFDQYAAAADGPFAAMSWELNANEDPVVVEDELATLSYCESTDSYVVDGCDDGEKEEKQWIPGVKNLYTYIGAGVVVVMLACCCYCCFRSDKSPRKTNTKTVRRYKGSEQEL